MKTCNSCNAIVDDVDSICPNCGKQVVDVQAQVRRLLMNANLHRIRGEYASAIDACTEVLRLKTDDAEVHSLLGDIYESSGKLDEAAKWFQMAIDLRPDSALDAAKLDRVRTKMQKQGQSEPDAKTGEWDEPLAEETNAPHYRLSKFVIISLASLMVFIAFGVAAWFVHKRGAKNENPPVYTHKPTIPVQPPTGNQWTPTQPPVVIPSTPAAPTVETPARPVAEQQILSNLATNPAISDRRLLVDDVRLDPRTSTLTVTFKLPESTTKAPVTHADILLGAAVVAGATFTSSPDVRTVVVRALQPMHGKVSTREPTLVFVGDTSRMVSGVDITQSTPEQLQQLFVNAWWLGENTE